MNRQADGQLRSSELFEDSILCMALMAAVMVALASGIASLGGF